MQPPKALSKTGLKSEQKLRLRIGMVTLFAVIGLQVLMSLAHNL